MNIKALKVIINSDLPDNFKEAQVMNILANDEKVIPKIMDILEQERRSKKELIQDLNLELSRAHCYIEDVVETKKQAKNNFNKKFVIGEIKKFYIKYKSIVTHCFNGFKNQI